MIEPSLNKLMEYVDSRYYLVIAVAKRARQITDGERPVVKCASRKPVTMAVHEVAAGRIRYWAATKNTEE